MGKRSFTYEQVKEWRKLNKDKLASQQARYRQRHKERLAAYYVEWRTLNLQSYLAYQASRKSRVRKATPTWADLELIRQFYLNCPEGYQVDHIIPIKGKNVCGLHVLNNLQYLSKHDNLLKGNKF